MLLSDAEILAYINEDLPYFDLTTSLQDTYKNAVLEIKTREDIIVSCVDISARIANLLGCEASICVPNSKQAKAGETIIKISGSYNDVHKVWKLAQITLEYACKISTYTNLMVKEARKVSDKCQILTTRKTFPFAKKLCLKAVLEGGGSVHRLNLSDSVLFFDNHIKAYDSFDEFLAQIPNFKARAPERKIIVECEELENFAKLLKAGADGIQCDKMSVDELKKAVNLKNEAGANTIIIASGGINAKNVALYAATGIDAVTTSAVYTQGMADLTSVLSLI
ncbi:ModD protein [Campylobacter sp.]|uniref:ModD protein n=1 Tax=Campylobacter sp. TaxID=205 RepID=UPI0026F78D4A|nr:ModD protein [Campylobacter sp.]